MRIGDIGSHQWLQNIPISCVMVMMTSDYIIVVTVELRHFTSLGYLRLTTGIPVGKPMGIETCGSEYLSSQVYTDLGSSSGCCKYLPQVLVRLRFYLSILLI